MRVSVNVFDPHASLPAGAASVAADGVVASLEAGMTVGEIAEAIHLRVGSSLADADVTVDKGAVTISLIGNPQSNGVTASLAILPVHGGEARTIVHGWQADDRSGKRWILEAAVETAHFVLARGDAEDEAARAAVDSSFGEFLSAEITVGEGANFDISFHTAN